MSERVLLLAQQDIISVIQQKMRATYDEARAIADNILKTIDWNNPALMHKGIRWIALQYLKKNYNIAA